MHIIGSYVRLRNIHFCVRFQVDFYNIHFCVRMFLVNSIYFVGEKIIGRHNYYLELTEEAMPEALRRQVKIKHYG